MMLIMFVSGYFVMGLIFLIVRFFMMICLKRVPNLILAVKNDFAKVYDYYRRIILSNPIKIKVVVVIISSFIISVQLMSFSSATLDILDPAMSTITYFIMLTIFAPPKELLSKEFPVEIFGFIYSILLMYLSAGTLIVETFLTNNFDETMWIYGYGVTLISYIICIATLSRFMDRDLSRLEIIFVGMVMMTVLEFITYYGIGFCGASEYDYEIFESSIPEVITTIINQGIFIASQSQILERSAKEVWGYIILNGTDVLTVTAVLGYALQKFMGIASNDK